MSKADFFQQLQERLQGLPHQEQHNIIRIYEDLFRQAELSGKSEQEVIESLGFAPVPALPPTPERIGGRFMKSAESGFRVGIAAIALGLFNLIFVLGPFMGISAALFAISLVSVLFAFSSIWIVIGTGVPHSYGVLLLEIFAALALTGLGVMMSIGIWKVLVGYGKLVKRYLQLNMKLIKGE